MDVLRATESYGLKVDGGHSKLVLDALKSDMDAAFDAKVTTLAADQGIIAPILASHSVLGCDYPRYYAFGAELRSKSGKYGGGTLQDEASLALAKWQARGCTNAVLTEIRNAFAIAAPTPPS